MNHERLLAERAKQVMPNNADNKMARLATAAVMTLAMCAPDRQVLLAQTTSANKATRVVDPDAFEQLEWRRSWCAAWWPCRGNVMAV